MKIIETVRRYFSRRKIVSQKHAILEKLRPLVSEHGTVCRAMKHKMDLMNTHLKYGNHTNLAATVDVLEQEYNVLEQQAGRIYNEIDELFMQLDDLEALYD